jgi:hypothetical protein
VTTTLGDGPGLPAQRDRDGEDDDRRRLSISLSGQALSAAKALGMHAGVSETEAVRRAIAFHLAFIEHEADGAYMAVDGDDGNTYRIKIVIAS